MPFSRATAEASTKRSAVQVSTWAGASIPMRRPDGCRRARSIVSSARSKLRRPAFTSQRYSTSWPFGVYQEPERKDGATQVRMPVEATSSSQFGRGAE